MTKNIIFCPKCITKFKMEEKVEIFLGDKFEKYYCPNCDTWYELVSCDYIEHLQEELESCIKSDI